MTSGLVRETASDRAVRRSLSGEELAWLSAIPAIGLAVGAIALLAAPVGHVLFRPPSFEYWSSVQFALQPKPQQFAAYLLVLIVAAGLTAFAWLGDLRRWTISSAIAERAVVAAQLVVVVAAIACMIVQRHVTVVGESRAYFTIATLVVALGLAAGGAYALMGPSSRAWNRVRAFGPWRVPCALAVIAATIVWLLPAVYTDGSIGLAHPIVATHMSLAFDEAMSVLDGRSPLVNMVTYGALWPYVIAPPLALSGGSLLAFTIAMTTISGLSLLAVYALLRRVTRSAVAGLALYLPFLATSFFRERGDAVHRYNPSDYFGVFPLRYAGPYLLAWLMVRHADGDRPRREELLFGVAGLVVLNNLDFGVPAFAATFLALLYTCGRVTRATPLRLARSAAAGLVGALVAVSALTLARAGSLPHLALLTRYGRLFALSGFSDLSTPAYGFHLVMLATAVGAILTATVRAARRHPDTTLTGALAWSGVFALGTGGYYMYRSHPEVLINLFSAWALAVALLLVAILRSVSDREPRRLLPAEVGVLFAFGLAACSIAQLPLPWKQITRIGTDARAQIYRSPAAARFIKARTHDGEHVVIITDLGHRLAYEAGVVDVAAYTGMKQMPSQQQFYETVSALRRARGTKLFLGSNQTAFDGFLTELPAALADAGFAPREVDPASGYAEYVDIARR